MEASQRVSSKVRRLRVFGVVVATLTYCVRNAGGLFVIAWFPCLLASATRLALEWLVLGWPPRMPAWLLSNQFDPPTWLTALAVAPFEAMAWAFVLSFMSDRSSKRGTVATPVSQLGWLRFELSPVIFAAAAILSIANLIDGAAQFAQLRLLVAAFTFFGMSENQLEVWAQLAVVIRIGLVAIVMAGLYLTVGHMLRTGTLAVAHIRKIVRGNWLRLIAAFFLLNVTLLGLDRFVHPATTRLARMMDDPLSWTLRSASIRYVLDFPFSMLWIVAWAVLVGIVLDALNEQPSADRDFRAAAS